MHSSVFRTVSGGERGEAQGAHPSAFIRPRALSAVTLFGVAFPQRARTVRYAPHAASRSPLASFTSPRSSKPRVCSIGRARSAQEAVRASSGAFASPGRPSAIANFAKGSAAAPSAAPGSSTATSLSAERATAASSPVSVPSA